LMQVLTDSPNDIVSTSVARAPRANGRPHS
jgi:hypothetical protein